MDAALYRSPDEKYLCGFVSRVPEDSQFAFKVLDEVTTKKLPTLPRLPLRAGNPTSISSMRDCSPAASSSRVRRFEKTSGC